MSASASTSQPAPAPPPPASVLFARGVIARLAIWPALRAAVEQSWGGPDGAAKRTWLASVLVDAFEQEDPAPDAEYVELTLLQVMEDEFDAVLEDDSAQAVAADVVRLWAEACAGRQEPVVQLEQQAERLRGKRVQMEEGVGEESDWEDDDDEDEDDGEGEGATEAPRLLDHQARPPRQEPEVDDDGFTMVKKGRGKGPR